MNVRIVVSVVSRIGWVCCIVVFIIVWNGLSFVCWL